MVRLHQHAKERLIERGATEDEVIATVKEGETFPAKYGKKQKRDGSILEEDGEG